MDIVNYSQFVLALLVLAGLLGAFAIGLKKLSTSTFFTKLSPVRDRRMRLLETLPIDPKRRVVLVQVDDREHVLMIGGGTDIVIEQNKPARSPKPLPTDQSTTDHIKSEEDNST